jgi:hypothetical protein
MKNRLVLVFLALLVALLSVGWLYPLWVAMTETLSYSQSIGMRLSGRARIPISDKAIMVGPGIIGIYRELAFAWAAVAGFAWSFVLGYRCLSQRRDQLAN